MPFAQTGDVRLYYEFSGPEDAPVIIQFGGGLFGRHNFGLVNNGFRERFRLLSFDARSRAGPTTEPRCSTPSASSASTSTGPRWAG